MRSTCRGRFWPSGQDDVLTCPDRTRHTPNFSDPGPVTTASARARRRLARGSGPGIPRPAPSAYHSHIARLPTAGAAHRILDGHQTIAAGPRRRAALGDAVSRDRLHLAPVQRPRPADGLHLAASRRDGRRVHAAADARMADAGRRVPGRAARAERHRTGQPGQRGAVHGRRGRRGRARGMARPARALLARRAVFPALGDPRRPDRGRGRRDRRRAARWSRARRSSTCGRCGPRPISSACCWSRRCSRHGRAFARTARAITSASTSCSAWSRSCWSWASRS